MVLSYECDEIFLSKYNKLQNRWIPGAASALPNVAIGPWGHKADPGL